ncbi:hypothetical protein JW948_03925 [bacterium]|nr:hypothetical protein [bacterium]
MNYFGVQASRSLGPVTVYGGLGMEKTSLTIGNADGVLAIEPMTLDSGNRTRINAGLSLSLLILKVHADYNVGDQNIFVAGVGLSLGLGR